jgi:hypothetical protein
LKELNSGKINLYAIVLSRYNFKIDELKVIRMKLLTKMLRLWRKIENVKLSDIDF